MCLSSVVSLSFNTELIKCYVAGPAMGLVSVSVLQASK